MFQGVGLKSLGLASPDIAPNWQINSPDSPEPIYNELFRFGVAAALYILTGLVQV